MYDLLFKFQMRYYTTFVFSARQEKYQTSTNVVHVFQLIMITSD